MFPVTLCQYQGAAEPIKDAKDSFRINYFLKIVDTTIMSFKWSFEMYRHTVKYLAVLYNIKKLNVINETLYFKKLSTFHLAIQGHLEGKDLRK